VAPLFVISLGADISHPTETLNPLRKKRTNELDQTERKFQIRYLD
jgi:hypothetical protein